MSTAPFSRPFRLTTSLFFGSTVTSCDDCGIANFIYGKHEMKNHYTLSKMKTALNARRRFQLSRLQPLTIRSETRHNPGSHSRTSSGENGASSQESKRPFKCLQCRTIKQRVIHSFCSFLTIISVCFRTKKISVIVAHNPESRVDQSCRLWEIETKGRLTPSITNFWSKSSNTLLPESNRGSQKSPFSIAYVP